ncbi:unnamed protein product [Rangifer tarandus platyrhynchus]|uniref:Uncharacterized protein n=2 Tax=Rangifer tarandus platyrhynchus TaxID=3082113 RepID=A0ABN8YT84_RANTA|nr:unnamed protein product [Rangifer tarandus platyrhynchus]CAI9702373.1 unnamed protein product [Rangifer tarandus platyrhynchus]
MMCCDLKPRDPRSCQRLRGNKDPRAFSLSVTLRMPGFQTSGLQNGEYISVPPSHQICGHLHHLRKPVHPGCSQQGSAGIWGSAPRWHRGGETRCGT